MARIRSLKPEFFLHEGLAKLSPLHRLLFAGLFGQADREGRLEDRPERIKAQVLPYDRANVSRMLDELSSAGFIVRYVVDGRKYIELPTFTKHQQPHVREPISTIPAPCKPGASTGPAPGQTGASPVPSTASCAGASGAGAGAGREQELSSGSGEPAGGGRLFDPPASDPKPEAWRAHASAECQGLIAWLREQVMVRNPDALWRPPEKGEIIAGHKLAAVCRDGPMPGVAPQQRTVRLMQAIAHAARSDFWQGKLWSLVAVHKNLPMMLAESAKDWSTFANDLDPLENYRVA